MRKWFCGGGVIPVWNFVVANLQLPVCDSLSTYTGSNEFTDNKLFLRNAAFCPFFAFAGLPNLYRYTLYLADVDLIRA